MAARERTWAAESKAIVDRTAIADTFEQVSLGSPRNAIGFVMWRVIHRSERELERALAPLELTHLQSTVLALVAWMEKEGGTASQTELARFGDNHVMQVSNVLKALEQTGMIDRSVVPGSARTKIIAITRRGLDTLDAAFPPAIDVQQRISGDAGPPSGSLLEALVKVDGQGGDAQLPIQPSFVGSRIGSFRHMPVDLMVRWSARKQSSACARRSWLRLITTPAEALIVATPCHNRLISEPTLTVEVAGCWPWVRRARRGRPSLPRPVPRTQPPGFVRGARCLSSPGSAGCWARVATARPARPAWG